MNREEWIFATHNLNKLEEVRAMVKASKLLNVEVKGLTDIGFHDEIAETANTLEGNAALKAETIAAKSGKTVFADDTGLEVDCLHGAPGVFSARYAGPKKSSASNIEKLLEEMEGCADRKARFRTVIALASPQEETRFFEGRVEGQILEYPTGDQGFGYDPVFRPDGYEVSFAEMNPGDKNKISHRARAFQGLIETGFRRST